MSKPPRSAPLGLDAATDELHRTMLAEALRQNATLAQAARQLQISLRRLHYLIVRHGIERTVARTIDVRFRKKVAPARCHPKLVEPSLTNRV